MAGSSILPLHSLRKLDTARLAQHHYAPNHGGIFSTARERQTPPTQLKKRRKIQTPNLEPDAVTSWIEPPFFAQLQRHLDKANHDHCLFLCWEESKHDQRAIPVLIKDPLDERGVYQVLRLKWHETLPWWKKNPFYGVIGLEEVEFGFVGFVNENSTSDYPKGQALPQHISIIVQKPEFIAIKQQLKDRLNEAEAQVGRLSDLTCPIWCNQDPVNGSWSHENPNCIGDWEPVECAFETFDRCRRELARLSLLSLPFLCFQNPHLAIDQRTLEGMAQESCIYRTSEISCAHDYKPRIVEQRFRGLILRAGWKTSPIRYLASSAVVVVVIVWKAYDGGWQSAVVAVSFFVMLLMLSATRNWEVGLDVLDLVN